MADEISEIKDKIDIVEFVNSYVPLKKTGRNFRALCPFHGEKTPVSLFRPSVNPGTVLATVADWTPHTKRLT